MKVQIHKINHIKNATNSPYATILTKLSSGGAAIAQWIRLHLRSCPPGFKSHLRFCKFLFELCHVEKTKITLNWKTKLSYNSHFQPSLPILTGKPIPPLGFERLICPYRAVVWTARLLSYSCCCSKPR